MSEFQLLDTNKYPLQITGEEENLVFYRWEHRATIGHGCREYIIFVDHLKGQSHIEEITGGHLEQIQDESLKEALTNFAMEKRLIELGLPPLRKMA